MSIFVSLHLPFWICKYTQVRAHGMHPKADRDVIELAQKEMVTFGRGATKVKVYNGRNAMSTRLSVCLLPSDPSAMFSPC